MISNLSITYPWWFLLLVVIIGLIYAGILYLGNKKQKISWLWRVLLFSMRFIVVSSIAFLLLSPFIKSKKKFTEKPIIIIGVDNSKSVVLGSDSLINKSQLTKELNLLSDELSAKYKVDHYLFGSKVKSASQPDFQDQTSDYSMFFNQLKEIYAGMNVGSVVLVGDGVSNRGIDPEFATSGLNRPIYTIALGDTMQGRDIKINDTRYNSIVYFEDEFPIEVSIAANGFKGKSAKLEAFAFGKKQKSIDIKITNDQFNKTVLFKIEAKKTGRQRIFITIISDENELIQENNSQNIFINVLDNRQKILILANAPHPDISAIKSSLELNKNYEIVTQFATSFKGNITEYDLVILYQLPSRKQPAQQTINLLKKHGIPLLFVAGKQSNFSRLSHQFDGVELKSLVNSYEESQMSFEPSFTLFSFDRGLAQQLETLPPLIVSFGNYQASLTASIFGYQRINNIESGLPLVLFNESDNSRSGAILGEGLWIWRMHSFLQYGNTKAFDNFISKSCQYVMARKDKRFFRVTSKGEYSNNEQALLFAELYNQSYEPVNEADVNLKLSNEQGEQFNYIFSPIDQSYSLDLDRLATGVYKYEAKTSFGGKNYTDKGEFVVSGKSIESRQLNANHSMLYRIAENSNGKMLYLNEIGNLHELLNSREDLQSKIYYEEKYINLNDLIFVIGLILFLLSVEWFLRKYLGDY